jgi:NitT/TauT family transport system substrate-binding protein
MRAQQYNSKISGYFTAFFFTCFTFISSVQAEPLKIGYSDWPGWVAWEVAIEKKWFAEAGVEVKFEWFDYVASMDAFAAGKLDAVTMTNGDTLVTGATGAKGVMIIINDYSNGNDMVIASPDVNSVAELKGKKIGVEVGFVSHLLLLNGLEKNGLTESDVTLVNVPTNETPQVLASGDVDAIVAWQPNSGQALNQVPGSRAVYSSADEPGLIYDVLAVSPTSLAKRKDDWSKVIDVWYKVVDYILDPATEADALAIMSARVGISPEEYKPFLKGTKILKLDEAKKVFEKGDGFTSLYGSTKISDDFNLKYEVYTEPQDVDSYIDPSLTLAK